MFDWLRHFSCGKKLFLPEMAAVRSFFFRPKLFSKFCKIGSSVKRPKMSSADLKSRIRIVESENESLEIVRSIINLGEPVAVDVEVSLSTTVPTKLFSVM